VEPELIMTLLGLFVVFGIGIVLMLITVSRGRKKRKEQEKEFVNAVEAGLINGTIRTFDDIYIVYKAIRGLRSSSGKQPWILIPWLESVVVKLHKREIAPEEKNTIIGHLDLIKNAISELEQEEPFSDLPMTERNLMTDALRFGQQKDNSLFITKLHDLSGVIKTRYEENEKLRETTKWSVPVSIIGIILTIVSLIFAIWIAVRK